MVIAGFVTDATLATKYKVTRQEYLSVPAQIRRRFRGYLQNTRDPVLTLKQFQQKQIARPDPVKLPARRIIRFE